MKYCYLQEGTAFKQVEDDYQPLAGEIVVAEILTQEELARAFVGYEAAFKKQMLLNDIANIQNDIKFRNEVFNNPKWANLEEKLSQKIDELNNL